jgi:aldehyde:ferredoxin oxidoreductase
MIGGYTGGLLRIDLSASSVKKQELDVNEYKNLAGGLGIAAKVMLEEVERDIEPFDPENRLILATGPLTGIAPAGNKSVLVSRSPLTNIWGDALFSADLGIELKRAGYDVLIVQGRAKKPKYIWIHDDIIEIKDADDIWGMSTFDTSEALREDIGEKNAKVVCIGPAGEKLVRLACVMSDRGRVAGRCGLGAVMGSKNLKAIGIRASGMIEIARKDEFFHLFEQALNSVRNNPKTEGFHLCGTSGSVAPFEALGNLPIMNFTRGKFSGIDKISGETMVETILTNRKSCYGCPIGCGRFVKIAQGSYAPMEGNGPEYETIAALGSMCLNENLESIAKANDICNGLGIDTISTGNAIAFAIECYENGIITKVDTEGIDLSWGKHEAIVKMVELIGRKVGFGAVLGEGVRIAAERIGRNSERYAMHVKGLEIPFHSPYRFKCMGLNYATSNRGACHNRGSPAYVSRGILSPEIGLSEQTDGFTIEGKGNLTKIHQDACAMLDALGMCKFAVFFCGITLSLVKNLYNAATGWNMAMNDLMRAGERIWNLERVFNVRMGVTREDDTLPGRFLKEPMPDGMAKGQVVELEPMLKEYYEVRGLDDNGKPKVEKLKELDLHFVIPRIK